MADEEFPSSQPFWQSKKRLWRYLQEDLLRLNFYRLHMLYFILVILIASIVIYGEGLVDDPELINGTKLYFIDALFLCCSAMTTTGLNTVNLGTLTGLQQAVLFVLMLIGNVVFVSSSVVLVRRHYFRRKLADLVQYSESGRQVLEHIDYEQVRQSESSSRSMQSTAASDEHSTAYDREERPRKRAVSKSVISEFAVSWGLKKPADGTVQPQCHDSSHRRVYHHQTGFGWYPAPWEISHLKNVLRRASSYFSIPRQHDGSYLSFDVHLDDRGRIRNLNEHERAELGGVEYRALDALLWILTAYYLAWLAIGMAFLVPSSLRQTVVGLLRSTQPRDLSPAWFGVFATASSFSNGGLNLVHSNLTRFRSEYLILTAYGALTLVGNTQFPVMLRLLVWILSRFSPQKSRLRQSLMFLLDHPRRCFTYMFPGKETWYLFAVQLAVDVVLWISFGLLNLGLPAVENIPSDGRIFDGLFQATGVRSSGAYIVKMSNLAPALLIVYTAGMYISSFPIVMTLRQTNLYEEQSIGIDEGQSGGGLVPHLRRQLSYDLWFQLLAWFLISIIERGRLVGQRPGFSLFATLFEVTSAYGNIGLSTGVPNDNYSLSGAFQAWSKLTLVAVMIRGRHRGLPFAIDRSILLPGEDLMHKLDQQYNKYGKLDPHGEAEIRRSEERSGDTVLYGGNRRDCQDPE